MANSNKNIKNEILTDSQKWYLATIAMNQNRGVNSDEFLEMAEEVVNHIIHKNIDKEAVIKFELNEEQKEVNVYNENCEVLGNDYDRNAWGELIGISFVSVDDAKEAGFLNANEGDIIKFPILFDKLPIKTLTAIKNGFVSSLAEKNKIKILTEYNSKIGTKLLAEVVTKLSNNGYSLRLEDGATAFLPYKSINNKVDISPGSKIEVFLDSVNPESKHSILEVSMISSTEIKQILETEIPEIANGDIFIRSIQRDPGNRAKVAVSPNPEKTFEFDLIGSVIGQNGNRIDSMSERLHGEKIDVIPYDDDKIQFIKNAMSPAQVLQIVKKNKKFVVIVPDSQLAVAIGVKGINVQLASRLVNESIDVLSVKQAIQKNISVDSKNIEINKNNRKRSDEAVNRYKNNRKNYFNDVYFDSFDLEDFNKEIEDFKLLEDEKTQQNILDDLNSKTTVKQADLKTKKKNNTEKPNIDAIFETATNELHSFNEEDEYDFLNKIVEYEAMEEEFGIDEDENNLFDKPKSKDINKVVDKYAKTKNDFKDFKVEDDLLNYGLDNNLDLSDIDEDEWK